MIAESIDHAAVRERFGLPDEQIGSVNDPRTREENGVRWNEKWVYLLARRRAPHRVLAPLRFPRRRPRGRRRRGARGEALSDGPPPLRPFGLVLRRDGTFWHEGVPVTHPRLARALRAGVRWADAEQTFIVQLRHFRGWLDVEDTAFFVESYDAATGEIEISDRTREPLDAATLCADPDDALRCTVKRRFPARFTRGAQEHLLAAVEVDGDDVFVRAGAQRHRAARLLG